MNLGEFFIKRSVIKYRNLSKYVFVLLISLFAFDSFAAECKYFDRVVYRETGDYSIYYHDSYTGQAETLESCSGEILITAAEYAVLQQNENIATTLNELFEFSTEDFALFNAICLVAFIGGHTTGRVLRLLGKTS